MVEFIGKIDWLGNFGALWMTFGDIFDKRGMLERTAATW